MITPLFFASGPATSSFNGLHPKSNFLARVILKRWYKGRSTYFKRGEICSAIWEA